MKFGFSQEQIIDTAKSLGLPTDGFVQRRVARAFDLVESNKVMEVDDGIFRVRSQYDPSKSYIVNVNSGTPSCDCPDGAKTINCKHRIASLLYAQKQAESQMLTIYDDSKNSYLGRGRWIVTDHKVRVKYIVYQNSKGHLICPCGKRGCEHRKAIRGYLNNGGGGNGNGRKVINDCGSAEALELQNRLNGNNGSNGNGANKAPSLNIDPSAKPFMESDELDAKQIETGEGGNVHHLSNGEYVIAFNGIMHLADKHDILTETWKDTPEQGYVTVKAMRKDTKNVRQSCQPVNGSFKVADGKALRNAVRMLIPIVEIKALEHKAKLEGEFSWEKAEAKCVQLAGTEANVDIIIHELVQADKLRADNPSHYNRTEWLMIYDACQKDAEQTNDGGDNTPSSYAELAAASVNDNYRERYTECKELVGMNETDLIIRQRIGWRYSYYKDRITNALWDEVLQECQWRKNARDAKGEKGYLSKQAEYDYIRDRTGYDVRSKKYVGPMPLNDNEFIEKCKEAISKVRDGKVSEANEMPLQNGNGSRKLQMDKQLKTLLVEANGTRKPISCREICEKFDGSIVTRLRAGIDSGADISTVEID